MIKSFRHKGLKRFYASGSTAGIQADHAKKLRMQLAALDTAISVEDMDMTFEFRDGNAYILDYEDYH